MRTELAPAPAPAPSFPPPAASPGAPRTVLRAVGDLTAGELVAWRALAEEAVEPNPFLGPDMTLAAFRHFGEPHVALAVTSWQGRWVAALPLRRRLGWRKFPGPCLTAWGHTHGFLNTPLVHPDHVEAATRSLVDRLLDDRRAGFVVLDLLGADGPVAAGLEAALAARGADPVCYEDFERAALRRRPEPSYLEGRLSPKRRRELRRQLKALERELGAPLTVVDRAEDPQAVERFLELEASGWKGQAGTAFASDPGHTRFFAEVCRAYAQTGRLQLLALQTSERAVAMKCNLREGDVTFCFKIAYDETLHRFSPGIQLELANIDRFHDDPALASWQDSCAWHHNAMINRLWPDRRRCQTLLVPTAGPLGRGPGQVVRLLSALRERSGRTS